MRNSPLDHLLEELLHAHDRQQTKMLAEPQRPRRVPQRRLVILPAALLVFAASAAAAIVVGTHRSAPLKGALPRQLLGSRYSLTVAPDLVAGHAGWCVALQTQGTKSSVLEDPSTCVSSDGGPLITRGGLVTVSPQTDSTLGWLLYGIVRAGVYALRRPDGTRILPVSSPDLPAQWKAAVTIQTNPKPRAAEVVTLVPVSAEGTAYSTATHSSITLGTVPVTAHSVGAVPCQVIPAPTSHLRLADARALTGRLPTTVPVNPGLLSCFSAGLTVAGRASRVALLVNAPNPKLPPGHLPGSRPVVGAQGIWVSPAVDSSGSQELKRNQLYTKRAGDACLVLETSAPASAAITALDELTARS